MTEISKLSPEIQSEIDRLVDQKVDAKLKRAKRKKVKLKIATSLLMAGLAGAGYLGVKNHLKHEFAKDKVEVRASTEDMSKKSHERLNEMTGTNKVLGVFGTMGAKAAQWLRVKQARDRK